MNKSLRNGLLIIATSLFFLLLGSALSDTTIKQENIKYFFLFSGLSISCLYTGLTWEKPSFGGGVVRKYAGIGIGALLGAYAMYLLAKVVLY